MDKLKEMNDKFFEENTLLKNQINQLKEENKELKEKLSRQNNIQTGEYEGCFPWKKHYMNNDIGLRTVTHHITFEKKYEKNPHVMVSISSLDAGTKGFADKTIRIKVYAINIDTSGFDIQFSTWECSTLFGIKVSWISFP